MRDVSCPSCPAKRTRLFFNEGETGAEGYLSLNCGCTFIILKKGEIPEPEYEDEGEHTKDRWPY